MIPPRWTSETRIIVSLVVFYLLAVLVIYLYFFLFFDALDSALLGLVLSLSVLAVFTLFSYIIVTHISKARWSAGLLGLRKEGLMQSFLLASVVSIIGPLSQLYTIGTSGMNSLVQSLLGPPSSLNQILHSLPASLFFFLILGVLAFGFFQALPCAFLDRYRIRWVIPVIVVMWAVLYGAADIVGMGAPPNPGDVGLLGVIFLLVYMRTKNSVGPIIAYVLLAEEPAWVALALLNSGAYVISLYMKVSWSLIALGMTTWRWARGRSAGVGI